MGLQYLDEIMSFDMSPAHIYDKRLLRILNGINIDRSFELIYRRNNRVCGRYQYTYVRAQFTLSAYNDTDNNTQRTAPALTPIPDDELLELEIEEERTFPPGEINLSLPSTMVAIVTHSQYFICYRTGLASCRAREMFELLRIAEFDLAKRSGVQYVRFRVPNEDLYLMTTGVGETDVEIDQLNTSLNQATDFIPFTMNAPARRYYLQSSTGDPMPYMFETSSGEIRLKNITSRAASTRPRASFRLWVPTSKKNG